VDESQRIEISQTQAGGRVDAVLAAKLPELSRSRIKALIESGDVTLDGKAISPKQKVKAGEVYCLVMPEPEPSEVLPVPMNLDIIYEDDDLLVINKPAGLTVHPAAGNQENTLVNGLLAYCGDSLSGIGGVVRPGIVHRLDKDTSGLMVVAKHDRAHQALSAQLSDRSLTRVYHALVWGCPHPAQGVIEGNIDRSPKDRKKMALVKDGGREAITHYHALRCFCADDKAKNVVISEVECRLKTGRTHQIRVHMSHAGHALVGDPLYGGASVSSRLSRWNAAQVGASVRDALAGFSRQALHAKELSFIHPSSGQRVSYTSSFPVDWLGLVGVLQQELLQE
jgi:23S rRNA pseudouridine1911/1915/1917 synthase